jgi:hypothetical protein
VRRRACASVASRRPAGLTLSSTHPKSVRVRFTYGSSSSSIRPARSGASGGCGS